MAFQKNENLKTLKNGRIFGAVLFVFVVVITQISATTTSPDPLPSFSAVRRLQVSASNCLKKIGQIAEASAFSGKPWQYTEAELAQIQNIWKGPQLSEDEQVLKLFDQLIDIRTSHLNPVSRFFYKGVTRDLKSGRKYRSIYYYTLGKLMTPILGPHYNPVFNRISNPFYKRADFITKLIDMHEATHGLDRNTNPLKWFVMLKTIVWDINAAFLRTPITPLLRYNSEAIAIGSQWELVRHIPLEMRKQLIQKFENEWRNHPLIQNDLAADEYDRETARLESLKSKAILLAKADIERLGRMEEARSILDPNFRKDGPTPEDLINFLKDDISPQTYQSFEDFLSATQTTRKALARLTESRQVLNKMQILPIDSMLFRVLKMSIESLKHADLSKEEFIRTLQNTHGYTFNKMFYSHYFKRPKGWLFILRIQAFFIIVMPRIQYWIGQYKETPLASIPKSPNQFPEDAVLIDHLLRMLGL